MPSTTESTDNIVIATFKDTLCVVRIERAHGYADDNLPPLYEVRCYVKNPNILSSQKHCWRIVFSGEDEEIAVDTMFTCARVLRMNE